MQRDDCVRSTAWVPATTYARLMLGHDLGRQPGKLSVLQECVCCLDMPMDGLGFDTIQLLSVGGVRGNEIRNTEPSLAVDVNETCPPRYLSPRSFIA